MNSNKYHRTWRCTLDSYGIRFGLDPDRSIPLFFQVGSWFRNPKQASSEPLCNGQYNGSNYCVASFLSHFNLKIIFIKISRKMKVLHQLSGTKKKNFPPFSPPECWVGTRLWFSLRGLLSNSPPLLCLGYLCVGACVLGD